VLERFVVGRSSVCRMELSLCDGEVDLLVVFHWWPQAGTV